MFNIAAFLQSDISDFSANRSN